MCLFAFRSILTCGSDFAEVICPAQNDARLARPALEDPSRQGRKPEDHGDVNQRHEEGVVEVLRGEQSVGDRRTYSKPHPKSEALHMLLREPRQRKKLILNGLQWPQLCRATLCNQMDTHRHQPFVIEGDAY